MNVAFRICLVVFVLMPAIALAQTQRTGDNNARAMQELQQLSSERVQLKADNDKLKEEVESLKKQLTAATADRSSLQQRLKVAELTAGRESAAKQEDSDALTKARLQIQELVAHFRETATTLKEVETDRNAKRNQLQTREQELKVCIERNVGLYDLSTEVLNRYEKKGVWTSLTEKEPFTKIQRTRLENLIDDYRERAKDLRVDEQTKK